MKIRISGAPVGQAIKSIVINDREIKIKDLMDTLKNELKLNPNLHYKLMFNQKVLDCLQKVSELNLGPSDMITLISKQAGATPGIRKLRPEINAIDLISDINNNAGDNNINRKRLIEDIIQCFPAGYLQTKEQISLLLFGDESSLDTFLDNINKELYPTPHTLDIIENRILSFSHLFLILYEKEISFL